jgi:hypothetical protein
MAKSKSTLPHFEPVFRRNWGYWDGRSARERGRLPVWSPRNSDGKHPFNQAYGVAFWQGWYGEPHPNTGKVPD